MEQLFDFIDDLSPTGLEGTVSHHQGTAIAVADFPAPLGAVVEIDRGSHLPLEGEVIGFQQDRTLVCPLGDLAGIRRGQRVRLLQNRASVRVGESLLGRVVDGRGHPLDSAGRCLLRRVQPLHGTLINPIDRPRIDMPLATGVRSIDVCLTCGHGQRMGIFAPPGVGKSTLLGMLARHAHVDVIVVGLIGERGREVREFLDRDLGPAGRKRSVVVVSTSDEPAPVRIRAALSALSYAEFFRDRGHRVLLLLDSLTRVAQAAREVGLAAGEPPTSRGYPPSVFSLLPRLVERAGRTRRGDLTAFFTVLEEGDQQSDVLSSAVRGVLDGHIALSAELAHRGQHPAVDLLASVSRCQPDLCTPDLQAAVNKARELLQVYQGHEELISIGAYKPGSNPRVDAAISWQEEYHRFFKQDRGERAEPDVAVSRWIESLQPYLSL